MSDHAWSYLPELVKCGILTENEAKEVVLGNRMMDRFLIEIHALVQEAHSRGENTIPIPRLNSLLAKIQMQESPNF